MTDKMVVLSTCGTAEEAERIAAALIEARVAACVNVVPGITSIYRWQGALERASECLLVIKSRRELFARLRAEIARLHTYEVPEIIALPVTDGAQAYLAWIDKETGG